MDDVPNEFGSKSDKNQLVTLKVDFNADLLETILKSMQKMQLQTAKALN